MTYAYTVTIVDPTGVANDTVLAANLTAALDAWGVYLAGKGSVDVRLNIAAATSSGELGEGGSEVAVGVGTDGARAVFQTGTSNELVTGTDPNGATDDGGITLNSTELSSIYFSANPTTDTAQRGKYDGLSILEHELGHIFGIDGFRDDTGALPADSESTWDQLVSVTGKAATFTGKYADAVYGAAVPVTTTYDSGEAYYHFANSTRDQASNDLMSGTGLPTDTVRTISPLDVGHHGGHRHASVLHRRAGRRRGDPAAAEELRRHVRRGKRDGDELGRAGRRGDDGLGRRGSRPDPAGRLDHRGGDVVI